MAYRPEILNLDGAATDPHAYEVAEYAEVKKRNCIEARNQYAEAKGLLQFLERGKCHK